MNKQPARFLVLTTAVVCAAAFLTAGHARAASATWAVNAAGLWSEGINWTDGAAPGATTGTTSTDIATFNRSTVSASNTVTLDANYNVAGITFNNDNPTGTRAYVLTNSGSSVLTLSPNAVIQNIQGGGTNLGINVIDLNMTLAGHAAINNSFSNSILHLGISAGTSTNVITTLADLGNIDLTFTGTSTASSLASMRINQASGTTLRLVKEGTGFWQLNGPASGASGLTGGLLVRQGGVSVGRSSAASIGGGPVILGDTNTVAGDLRMSFGSSVTLTNTITVASSAATSVIIERGGGSGAGTISSNINLNRDLVLRQGTTNNQNLTLGAASSVTGTGNLIISSSVASAGNILLTGSINMAGELRNLSATNATGNVAVAGAIGTNVTGVTQNSLNSRMLLASSNNAYTGNTTVTAGTLAISNNGTLGASSLVLNGGTFDITNAATGVTIGSGKSVSGDGAITTTGKTFTIDGTLAPGLPATNGTLTVTGTISVPGTAQFRVFANGVNDKLIALGGSTLGGTVAVAVDTNYAPAGGDSFDFVVGAISGTPALSLPALGGGLTWVTNAFLSSGVLSIQAAATNNYASWVAAWQEQFPAFTNAATDSNADPDADGFDNAEEFAFDGNPMVGTPALLTAEKDGTNAVFRYLARNSGVDYSVWATTNLATGTWTNTGIVATNSSMTNTNNIFFPADYTRKEFTEPAVGSGFYRVKAVFTP